MGSKKSRVIFLNPTNVGPRINTGCKGKDGKQKNTEDGSACSRCGCLGLQSIIAHIQSPSDALQFIVELTGDFRKGVQKFCSENPVAMEGNQDYSFRIASQLARSSTVLIELGILHPTEVECIGTILEKASKREDFFGLADVRPVQEAVFFCAQRPMAVYDMVSVQPGSGYFEVVNSLAYYVVMTNPLVSLDRIMKAIEGYRADKYGKKEKLAVFAFCLAMFLAGESLTPATQSCMTID